MFIEVDKNNFSILDQEYISKNNFFSVENAKKELEINPFGKFLLLIEENKELIGYIYYSDIYDRVEINQIEINFIHRNCGKGSKMLQKLIEIVDKNITLEVKIDNFPAIALYKKFNFVEKAIRKGYYQGIDGILMERKKTL